MKSSSGGPGEIRDVRLHLAPKFSFGGRHPSELDRLATNTPAYCKSGTHRAPFGETLLDHGRRFDKKSYAKLVKEGRHWKATPGPGAYRTPRTMGHTQSDEAIMHFAHERLPIWKFGTGPQSKFVYDNVGTSGKTPGPGTYRTWTELDTGSKRGGSPVPRWPTAPISGDVMVSPNLVRSQSSTLTGRHEFDLDKFAECNPFYCKFGTHRAPHGESLLDHGRRFDKDKYAKLLLEGRHWKATPGPGAYRSQRFIGEASGDEMTLHVNRERLPIWKFGTKNPTSFQRESMGTSYKSPGPGTYKTFSQFSI